MAPSSTSTTIHRNVRQNAPNSSTVSDTDLQQHRCEHLKCRKVNRQAIGHTAVLSLFCFDKTDRHRHCGRQTDLSDNYNPHSTHWHTHTHALISNKLLTQALTSKCALLGNTQMQTFTFLPIKHSALRSTCLVQLPTKKAIAWASNTYSKF